MLKLLFIGFSSFLITFSGAMMPGLLFAVTVYETPKRGIMTGAILVTGHGLLEFALLLLIIFGLGKFLQMRETFVVLAFIGAVFLLVMAVSMLRSIPNLSLKDNRQAKGSLLFAGVLLSLANPYWSFWWATMGMSYLAQAIEIGILGILTFFIVHILGDYVWYTGVSFFL